MAAELPAVPDLQAVAFHLFTRCSEQQAAFEECMDKADKRSACAEQFKELASCATTLVGEAAAKASHEFKEYAHCLDLTRGKYKYCQPEQKKFEEAFPKE